MAVSVTVTSLVFVDEYFINFKKAFDSFMPWDNLLLNVEDDISIVENEMIIKPKLNNRYFGDRNNFTNNNNNTLTKKTYCPALPCDKNKLNKNKANIRKQKIRLLRLLDSINLHIIISNENAKKTE